MSQTLDNLTTEVALFRETYQNKKRTSSPEAKALVVLNTAWGEFNAAHQAKIANERATYLSERKRLLDILQTQKAERDADTTPTKRGPAQRPEYPEGVKIAAYLAFREFNKGVVRSILGLTGGAQTETLNTLLAEGQKLVEEQGL